MNVKVTIRKKAISKRRHSIYLDFWPPVYNPKTGKPGRREFLGLYTFDNPGTSKDREHNTETMTMAQTIRNRRLYELNQSLVDSKAETQKKGDFLVYFRSLAEERAGRNRGIWISALRYLKKFAGGPLPFSEINEKKIAELREYLESRYLAQNTKATYFIRIRTALKQAFRDGLLKEDINHKITGIREQKTPRMYLNLEELNRLAATPCKDDQLRRAGLFSALTGLKFCDIRKMTWQNVHREGDKYFLEFWKNGISEPEIHPISGQAYEMLGPAGRPGQSVFQDLYKSVYNNSNLSDWLEEAGIKKKISFSGFRHSFAVNQLFLGTDIYTVSKMLGHQDLKSTLVYAKIADELKTLAANRIKLEF